MAWLDDRAWCHPKLVNLSDKAFRIYMNGISYASGMGTRGELTRAQIRLLGCDQKRRLELIKAGLWDVRSDGAILIHDWDAHNGKRDDRRAADRERKRQERAAAREQDRSGHPQDRPKDSPQDTTVDSPKERPQDRSPRADATRPRGSEGSEKKQPVPEPEPEAKGAGAGAGTGIENGTTESPHDADLGTVGDTIREALPF